MTIKQHKYTTEQEAWLRNHIDDFTYSGLAKEFNKIFNTDLSSGSIADKCIKRLHLHKSINRGSVRKGERRNTNTLPVGQEYIDYNNKAVWIKISNYVNSTSNRRMPSKVQDINWKRKKYIVWEQAGKPPIKENEVLIHLNKDWQDCNINNLYKVSREVNFMMAKNGWYTTDRDHTLVGIKWCELFYAIKNT